MFLLIPNFEINFYDIELRVPSTLKFEFWQYFRVYVLYFF